jgi:hypothetical protein
MNFEIETKVLGKKSESSDFYVDFSLKLLSALKERVREHNDKNEKKVSLNQVIEKYCSAASIYLKDESIDINTYSMANVNEFLEGGKGNFNLDKAEKDIQKYGLDFDFENVNNLYISYPKQKTDKWFEI